MTTETTTAAPAASPRDAARAAIARHARVAALYDRIDIDDHPTITARLSALWDETWDAAEAAKEAYRDSDEPREWTATDGNGDTTHTGVWSSDLREEIAGAWSDCWGDVESTFWVRLRVTCDKTGEEHDLTVTVEPEAPECIDDREHDWCAPLEVVGGIAENPGVWGKGGGVICKTVCRHCGCYRIWDSWAQDESTGEQGLESVSYEEADEGSLAWVAGRIIEDAREALRAAGYDTHERCEPRLVISDAAPDSEDYGGNTEPGSDWDDECDRIIAGVRTALGKLRANAEWSDNDIIITAEV